MVGGIVTDLTSWRVIFWAYLPLAAALAAVIAVSVPRDGARRQAESLNLAGSLIFTAAVMAFVVGATVIAQPGGRVAGALLLAACVVLAGGFVLADRRAVAPLLPRELIRSRPLRLGTLGALLNTATTSSVLTLVTLYLQNSLQRTPLQAAATLLPFSLAVIAGSALAAAVQRRTGQPQTDRRRTGQRRTGQRAGPPRLVAQRLIAAGLALIAVADAALIPLAALAWAVPVCAAGAGAGIGLSSVAATGLGTDVAPRWRGGASGIINTAAQLGTAVGIAALILVAAATGETPALGTPPPRIAWAVAVLAAAAGAVRFALARPGAGRGNRRGGSLCPRGSARGARSARGTRSARGARSARGTRSARRARWARGAGCAGSGGCLRLKDAPPGGRRRGARRVQRPWPSRLAAAMVVFSTRANAFQPTYGSSATAAFRSVRATSLVSATVDASRTAMTATPSAGRCQRKNTHGQAAFRARLTPRAVARRRRWARSARVHARPVAPAVSV